MGEGSCTVRITIISVGKLKERYWRDALDEYLKRLSAYATIKQVEVDDRNYDKLGNDKAIALEGLDVVRAIDHIAGAGKVTKPYVIVLDKLGRQHTSEGFADMIEAHALAGRSSLVFVIGGSIGVAPMVLERADELLSFGDMTYPHNLARVMLSEQIYRAFKILKAEPYHK